MRTDKNNVSEAKTDPLGRPEKIATRNVRSGQGLSARRASHAAKQGAARAAKKVSTKPKIHFQAREALIEGLVKRMNKSKKQDHEAALGHKVLGNNYSNPGSRANDSRKKAIKHRPANNFSHPSANYAEDKAQGRLTRQNNAAEKEHQAKRNSAKNKLKVSRAISATVRQRRADEEETTPDTIKQAGGDPEVYKQIKKSKQPGAPQIRGDKKAGPLGHSRRNTFEKPKQEAPGAEHYKKGTIKPPMSIDKINQTGSSGKTRRAGLAKALLRMRGKG